MTSRSSPKLNVGILGSTGMVGQHLVLLLAQHPWFIITVLAASAKSAEKTYKQAVSNRWHMKKTIPNSIKNMKVLNAVKDINKICQHVDLVFSAFNLDKEATQKLEEAYAKRAVAVVSTNSAHRMTDDIPMIIPEINADHTRLIKTQQAKRGWKKGFIAAKPNCSIQSYVPALDALIKFRPQRVIVSTYQAVSGAGKTLESWKEMHDNVIPYIGGEEEKSEKEPLKIWGQIKNGKLKKADFPKISATCVRVPVSDGHLATVEVQFAKKPTRKQIIDCWKNYSHALSKMHLPSSPKAFLKYFDEENQPQTKLHRERDHGMGISVGRLREGNVLDWKFVCLSHNTIRGAAGGAILLAELLKAKEFIS